MNLIVLARGLARAEGQDWESLPVDMDDWQYGHFARDRAAPFQIDYLALAQAQEAAPKVQRRAYEGLSKLRYP